MSDLLRLEQVTGFRGGRILFEGLSLALGPGEAALVTGPNGVGKSSLIRLAAGLLRPASGEVVRAGTAAFADEKLALDPKQTLRRAMAFWAGLDRTDPIQGIAAMQLRTLLDVPVRMLSAGQRKRAVLARAIGAGSRLWLFDEPANGLDSEGVQRLAEVIAAHREGGGAILAASHQPLGLDGARVIGL